MKKYYSTGRLKKNTKTKTSAGQMKKKGEKAILILQIY